MTNSVAPVSLSRRLTSRKGAAMSLGIAVLAWVALWGMFGQAEAPGGNASAPPDSESSLVAESLTAFADADVQSVLVVASRADATMLTSTDLAALERLAPTVDQGVGVAPTGPVVSDDGMAAVISTQIAVAQSNAATAAVIKELRSTIAASTPPGLALQVTGGPAFGADVTSAFDGADFTLLAVTILIVAVLLIATYRSPVLWLVPLTVVAVADQVAGKVTAALGTAWNLQFDGGIISVLVFGAGTNYALLLISRYREELRLTADHREALSTAWRKTAPAVFASNLTVVLALLTLVFAAIPGTRGLGLTSGVGLLIALGSVMFALPPLLAMLGRRVFWPLIPRPSSVVEPGTAWQSVATRVMRRPSVSLTAGFALLAVMATGLIGTTVGLDQIAKFRVQSESATGLIVLSAHFPGGEAQPVIVVAQSERAAEVVAAVTAVEGVVRARAVETTPDGTLTKIVVIGDDAPGTQESLTQVEELRRAAHAVPGADARVGGAVATDLDARAGNQRDLLLIAPLVLAVNLVVLVVLLQALIAPVLLLVVNIASAVAAIGAGAWLSRLVFDQPGLDPQVPLLAFLFLVALGIDYTIFLVHRARAETPACGTREAMVRAVARTGSVITSAGIVLAAVFAALGLLPLVTLGQIGLIVGIGVVVDTLVVRTVIVPSLFGILGDRMWWPGRVPGNGAQWSHEHREHVALNG